MLCEFDVNGKAIAQIDSAIKISQSYRYCNGIICFYILRCRSEAKTKNDVLTSKCDHFERIVLRINRPYFRYPFKVNRNIPFSHSHNGQIVFVVSVQTIDRKLKESTASMRARSRERDSLPSTLAALKAKSKQNKLCGIESEWQAEWSTAGINVWHNGSGIHHRNAFWAKLRHDNGIWYLGCAVPSTVAASTVIALYAVAVAVDFFSRLFSSGRCRFGTNR